MGADDLCIVGMAAKLPGARDLDELWSLLLERRTAITPAPPDRTRLRETLTGPGGPLEGEEVFGGFLPDLFDFDPTPLRIPAADARVMDPQATLFLELSLAALRDARVEPASLKGQRVGIAAGISGADFARVHLGELQSLDPRVGLGGWPGAGPSRLAYAFDFQGPCVGVDTACSSALSAVLTGASWLRDFEAAPFVIVGGTNAVLHPGPSAYYLGAGLLSIDGRCSPFSENASGYVRSEGGAAFVLCRRAEAERLGLTVRAAVLGWSQWQDGRRNGLGAPNGKAQRAMLHQAWVERAGLELSEAGFIEAHGSCTLVGDAIEFQALQESAAGGSRPIPVGSVKANLGHLEAASGAASLAAAVLALEHGVFPGQPAAGALNPDLARGPFFVASEPVPLTSRWAGVTALSLGGTNVHLVIHR